MCLSQLKHHPVSKAAVWIPGQGTQLGCVFNLQLGMYGRQLTDVSLSLPISSLSKINKHIFKNKINTINSSFIVKTAKHKMGIDPYSLISSGTPGRRVSILIYPPITLGYWEDPGKPWTKVLRYIPGYGLVSRYIFLLRHPTAPITFQILGDPVKTKRPISLKVAFRAPSPQVG